MRKKVYSIAVMAVIGAALIVQAGCGPRERFDPTPEGEFEAAYHEYEEEHYSTAIEKLKELIYKYPGSDLVEQARYYLADSYFLNEDYLLAANEFELLNREFPQGRFADVSLFKAGLAYQEMSRRPERDQTETHKSLETLQTLLAKYPSSEYVDTVRVHIRQLQDKLAVKEYRTAMFYYEHEIYDSSIIYFKSVLSNYPDSKVMPDVLYHLYQASREMGYPDDAEDARNWLCQEYAGTEYAKELCTEQPEALSGSNMEQGSGSAN